MCIGSYYEWDFSLLFVFNIEDDALSETDASGFVATKCFFGVS